MLIQQSTRQLTHRWAHRAARQTVPLCKPGFMLKIALPDDGEESASGQMGYRGDDNRASPALFASRKVRRHMSSVTPLSGMDRVRLRRRLAAVWRGQRCAFVFSESTLSSKWHLDVLEQKKEDTEVLYDLIMLLDAVARAGCIRPPLYKNRHLQSSPITTHFYGSTPCCTSKTERGKELARCNHFS